MTRIVGVRFRSSGKVYYFDPGEFTTRPGSHVIVETVRGVEYGTVVGDVREIEDSKITQPLRCIVRVASEEDELRAKGNREKEKEAIAICKEKIRSRGLEMKLIDAEYTFDNNKILFYFTADGRVDFRELVKDLASVFRTRIELRQIGVRDETKILGGIGICGRPLCCHTYLTDFVPVSIKMAKEQNLSLNPTKISGVCGRLMCCLKNEEETYEYLNSQLPSVGETVTTPTGAAGTVSAVSVLRQRVKVVIEENDEKDVHEYDVKDLQFKPRKGKDHHKKDKDRDKDKDKDRDRDREKDRDRDKNRDKERDKERDKDREKDRDKERDKDREKDRDKDHDKERETEKERRKDKDRGKDRDKTRDRDKDRDREKDPDSMEAGAEERTLAGEETEGIRSAAGEADELTEQAAAAEGTDTPEGAPKKKRHRHRRNRNKKAKQEGGTDASGSSADSAAGSAPGSAADNTAGSAPGSKAGSDGSSPS